jgi:elongation factor P
MIPATQIREGMVIEWKGEPHRITSMTHVTPGKGRAHIQTKLVNIKSGTQYNNRFRSDEKVNVIRLDSSKMEFLYRSGDQFTFMDTESYEQHNLSAELLGKAIDYLVPNVKVQVESFQGDLVGVELPLAVELKIEETDPALKGATASGSPKPATLETGLVVKVPKFLTSGEVIRVDTRDGSFIERVQS